ncbi:MAG TPA: tripartite tricarboxylate transporter substrate binding protein, partial [Burkholderiales bacterium]|nr:tripartite tricarboxylate transporter substrate binding protein [Burkholderiales bacterium]
MMLRAAGWLLLAASGMAAAQQYPAKPIRVVVPFPSGGPSDIVGRVVSQKLSEAWGQPVIVDNHAGAGGVIGTEYVAKGPADGYQILHGTIGGLTVAMSLQPNRGYDTLRDFVPITQTVTVTNFLVVHPTVPAKSVRELIALAKTRPGKLNYASSGSGTGPHLAGELLKYMAGIDLTHVPYKGSAPGLTAMLSGEVDITFENSLLVMPHIASGKVRPLGVTGTQRSKLLPALPTIAETLPGYNASGWYGFVAPAATPKDVVVKLSAEMVRILRQPDVVTRLAGQGAEPVASTPDEFAAFIRAEIDKWSKLVAAAKMRA